MNSQTHRTTRTTAVLSALAAVALLFIARQSIAGGPGNFSIKTPDVTEKNGEWHVKVRIDLPRPPGMMHSPMRFTFSKEAVDERAIMSKGAEPVHHRVVLETAVKQIVGLDVDFADASGKVFKSTYFEFDLKRADGYFEAGEYVVSLNGPDGDVGNNQKITLKGDNPPVYRGAMDFTEKPGKKGQKGVKLQAISNDVDGGSDEVAKNDTPTAAAPVAGEVAPVGEAPGMVPKGSFNRTAEEEAVHEHPGCGCFMAGVRGSSLPLGAGAAFGVGFVLARRRRAVLRSRRDARRPDPSASRTRP
jgi:hypothetical protein